MSRSSTLSKKCTTCGSRSWRKVEDQVVCSEGHLLVGNLVESVETESASQHTTFGQKNKSKRSTKDGPHPFQYFHGDRGTFLVWQCLQFILKSQIEIMIDSLGYPMELEDVCRDLWLKLVISSAPEDGPRKYALNREDASKSYSGRRQGTTYRRVGKRSIPRKDAVETPAPEDTTSESESEKEDERLKRVESSSDEDDLDIALSKFRTSLPPSASVRDKSPSPGDIKPTPVKRPAQSRKGDRTSKRTRYGKPGPLRQPSRHSHTTISDPLATPRVDFTLIVIYLGCLILRIPVGFSDIIKLASSSTIPFLNLGRVIPATMRNHLSMASNELFCLRKPPSATRPNGILKWLARLVRFYKDDWKVIIPEPNFKMIAWRLCKTLACPPIIYSLTLKLLAQLPKFSMSPRPTRRRRYVEVYPIPPERFDSQHRLKPAPREVKYRPEGAEVTILAAISIALDTIYGLSEMYPHEADEELSRVLHFIPPVYLWLDALDTIAEVRSVDNYPYNLWRYEVTQMSDNDIDLYIAYCEDTFTPSTSKLSSAHAALFDDPSSKPRIPVERPSIDYIAQLDSLDSIIHRLYQSYVWYDALEEGYPEPLIYKRNRNPYAPEPVYGVVTHLFPSSIYHDRFIDFAAPLVGHSTGAFKEVITRVEQSLKSDEKGRARVRFHLWGGFAQYQIKERWKPEIHRRKWLERGVKSESDVENE